MTQTHYVILTVDDHSSPFPSKDARSVSIGSRNSAAKVPGGGRGGGEDAATMITAVSKIVGLMMLPKLGKLFRGRGVYQ